ncbi:unnamed protein product [Prorocentrum cordatum]|uniref:Uncharacterized protein n=1 Tax=Prorocentrum cordatum TaxID=2364126 RepID=A0ABN9V2A1_9DINO|nr:unnamed protein product [Polarella glacialis]
MAPRVGPRLLLAAGLLGALRGQWEPTCSQGFAAGAAPALRGARAAPGFGRRGAAPRRRLPPRGAAGAEEVFGLTLPPDDVVDAVEKAGTRVTAADVAAAGGMGVERARKGLVALAACLGGEASLEVSRSGEIVYVFPQETHGAHSRDPLRPLGCAKRGTVPSPRCSPQPASPSAWRCSPPSP